MRYANSCGKMASTTAHAQILDSVYVQYRDESVVYRSLRGLAYLYIALIDPTDGSWSDDLWRPMIDAVYSIRIRIFYILLLFSQYRNIRAGKEREEKKREQGKSIQ